MRVGRQVVPCFVGVLALISSLVLMQLPSRAAPAAETTLVGVAKVDITPETPVRMYGYGARKTESEGGWNGRLCAAVLGSREHPALCGATPLDRAI